MEDKIIDFDTAKLAKESGFNITTLQMYGSQVTPQLETYNLNRCRIYNDYTLAPTQSLLQKWLREICDIHISIIYNEESKNYDFVIYEAKENEYDYNHITDENEVHISYTYEKALEEALFVALTSIIDNQ